MLGYLLFRRNDLRTGPRSVFSIDGVVTDYFFLLVGYMDVYVL